MNGQEGTRDLLVRQYEYFQYLFEQEQKRAASIVGGAKVYIAFIVFILGSTILKLVTPDKIITLFSRSETWSGAQLIGISLVAASGAAMTIAVVFTILVLKVWRYDRLCDPLRRFAETLTMEDELEVLSKCILDLAVATSRNNHINNKRAEYLTRGLKCLLAGTLLSIVTIFTLNLIT